MAKKKKKSSFYDPEIEKERLRLMREELQWRKAKREQGETEGVKSWKKDISSQRKILGGELAIKKQEKKLEEKRLPARISKKLERIGAKVERALKKRVVSRRILKKSKPGTLLIKQKEPSSILGDPNKFFKDEWNEAKKSMFM